MNLADKTLLKHQLETIKDKLYEPDLAQQVHLHLFNC